MTLLGFLPFVVFGHDSVALIVVAVKQPPPGSGAAREENAGWLRP